MRQQAAVRTSMRLTLHCLVMNLDYAQGARTLRRAACDRGGQPAHAAVLQLGIILSLKPHPQASSTNMHSHAHTAIHSGELLAIKEVSLRMEGPYVKEAVEQLEQEVGGGQLPAVLDAL